MPEKENFHKDRECIGCQKFYNCKGKLIKGKPCLNIKTSDGSYEKPQEVGAEDVKE